MQLDGLPVGVYFNSKRLTVTLRGGPNSAVDEMVHVVPARATRTRSIPTREPEMNSVNSAVPSKAWLTGTRRGLRC